MPCCVVLSSLVHFGRELRQAWSKGADRGSIEIEARPQGNTICCRNLKEKVQPPTKLSGTSNLSFSINSIHNLNIRIQAKKLWVSCLTEIYLAMFPVFSVILRNVNRNTCTVAHQTTTESSPQCTWSHFHIIAKSLHYPGWFRAKNLRVKLVKLQMNFGLFCRTWLWF